MPTFLNNNQSSSFPPKQRQVNYSSSSLPDNTSSILMGTEVYIILWLTFALFVVNIIFGLGKCRRRNNCF